MDAVTPYDLRPWIGVYGSHIKAELPIGLGRPRHFDDTLSAEFVDLHRQVFECIREETMKSMEGCL